MPAPQKALTRVGSALKRLGLLDKSCDYIAQATGMDVPCTTDPTFSTWLSKLEKLPIKRKRYHKRELQTRRTAKAAQAHIYYTTKKAKKNSLNAPPSPP